MWSLVILLSLAGQVGAPETPAAYAASLDASFEAMKRSAHVYCAGINETPCVHDQAGSIGWVKEMVTKGAWPIDGVKSAIAQNTRDGAVNWVGVRSQASAEYGATNQAELDRANASLANGPRRNRSTTTECRTYAGKRYARTTCTTY